MQRYMKKYPRLDSVLNLSSEKYKVMSEEAVFLGSFGQQYGYLGRINKIRKQEFNRLEGNDRLIDRN